LVEKEIDGRISAKYENRYKDLVKFDLNNHLPRHRWYSFVEGYSSELVRQLIGESGKKPDLIYDPFGGVGTTSLTAQELGIRCISNECNPFIFDVARSKIFHGYSRDTFYKHLEKLEKQIGIELGGKVVYPVLESRSIIEREDLDKWLLNDSVARGVFAVAGALDKLEATSSYKRLFRVVLGGLLIRYSNVFRNGKALSYRQNWRKKNYTTTEFVEHFISECRDKVGIDITTSKFRPIDSFNYQNLALGDSRVRTKKIDNNCLDMVITSPPYLNSRDYTDIYRLELWVLGYVKTYFEERKVRKGGFTSHVQIKLPIVKHPKNKKIEQFLEHLGEQETLWNSQLPMMVAGFFAEMESLLSDLRPKLKKGGRVFINISNSAYYGQVCAVDEIIAEIAQSLGYSLDEIRIARHVKASSQQKSLGGLRESIIVLDKK